MYEWVKVKRSWKKKKKKIKSYEQLCLCEELLTLQHHLPTRNNETPAFAPRATCDLIPTQILFLLVKGSLTKFFIFAVAVPSLGHLVLKLPHLPLAHNFILVLRLGLVSARLAT